jgi:predicted lipoprotein with Yx(FWY)xxD motif
MRTAVHITALILAVGLAGVGVAQPAGIHVGQTPYGPAWVDADGMTLYVSMRDTAGVSNCDSQCVRRWPPVTAQRPGQEGDFKTIRRPDGQLQWSYSGQPLYRWVLDLSPGQATGQDVGGVWRVARPQE